MSSSNSINLAVIGKPISQSLSPIIHNSAFKQTGLTGLFLRLGVESVQEALATGIEMGLKGLNITAPFKERSLIEVKSFGREVSQVGAANTILFGDTTSLQNTDLYGITHSLGLTGKRADGKTALIIGAGGAAKAAAYALKQIGCRVFICNRTLENAEHTATLLGVNVISFDDGSRLLKNCDYLINTVSTNEELVELSNLSAHTLILDAIYAKETPFSKSCSENPYYIDGRIWLLNQGIKAFELFTNSKLTDSQYLAIKEELFTFKKKSPPTISLIGMMGAGKSSVGSSLASILGKEFVDLDEVVEKKAGCSIAKLVTERGEEIFRKLETECLAEVLESKPKILSCGGGVVGTQHNRELLKGRTIPVWLWASKEELTKRLAKFSNRPLLLGQDLPARISELLDQRFSSYGALSDLVIPTTGKTTIEIAQRIAFEFFDGN